jgi:CoA:oxalate CoA-transferase
MKPLQGLKVLDMTHVLAGPYCTYQLGMLGAEVTKVEALTGDMVRSWGGTREQVKARMGSGFIAQNAGKRSLAIDMENPEGAEIIRDLAARADIVVQNYRPGVLARYRLDYENVKIENQKVVYASISAFGQNGPEGDRPGFDDVIQATSGFMSINVRGDGPIRTGGPVLDYATGMHATAAVLAAVLMQQQTGEPQHVDIAMQDVTMLLMNRHTHITATTGTPPQPGSNRDAAMLGRFKTSDGYVMLAGYQPKHCRSICKAMGLAAQVSWSDREFSQRNDELEQLVEARLMEKPSQAWDEIFQREGVVAGAVRDIKEVLETGQPEARGLLSTRQTSVGEQQITSAGYRINDQVFEAGRNIPHLGENTREVLTELGLSEERIKLLTEQGVVKQT